MLTINLKCLHQQFNIYIYIYISKWVSRPDTAKYNQKGTQWSSLYTTASLPNPFSYKKARKQEIRRKWYKKNTLVHTFVYMCMLIFQTEL